MIFASKNLRHQPYNNQCLNPKYQDVLLSGQDQKLLHRKPFGFKKLLKKGKSLFPTIKYIEILDCGNDTGLALEAIHHEINLKIKCNKIVLEKIKNICKVGTSADKQIKVFKEEMKKSNNKKLALDQVLKFLVKETMNF